MAVVMYERRLLLIGPPFLAPRGQSPMNVSAPHSGGRLIDGRVSARRRALGAGPSSERDVRERTCSEHSARRRRFLSRRQRLEQPGVAPAAVAQAVVQAVVAVLPELVGLGADAEASPFVRERRFVAVALLRLAPPALERLSVGHD